MSTTASLLSNWLGLGYYLITVGGVAPNGGVPLQPRPVLNFIGTGGLTITAADNPSEGPAGSTDVTFNGAGGGGGGAVLPRTSVTSAGITASAIAALVTANGGAWLDVDCSGGAVAIGMPNLPAGTPITVYILAGDPSAHAITLTATNPGTIQHQNGPATATYGTPPTLQDAATATWVFDAAGYLGTTSTYRAIGSTGSYTYH